MSSSRTKCLSTKLTEAEYARLERAAGAQTLSAWARAVLLDAAAPRPPEYAAAAPRPPCDPMPLVDWQTGSPQGSPRGSSVDQERTALGTLTRSSVWVPTVLAFACLSAGAIAAYRYTRIWTPLQRAYLVSYVWSAVAISHSGSYELLVIVDRTERRTALDADVVPLRPTPEGDTFGLSATAVSRGAVRLTWQRSEWDHAALYAFLRQAIYQDQTLLDLARPALWSALGVLVAALISPVSNTIGWRVIRRATRSAWTRSARARTARGGCGTGTRSGEHADRARGSSTC
jgi:hypothetical protein